MNSFVTFTFLDKNDKTHDLIYYLYESNLVQRWIDVLKKNIVKENSYIHSFLMNYTYERFPEILTEFNQIITKINERYDKILPKFPDTSYLDQEILNHLHEEFESYGDRIEEFIEEKIIFADLHARFLRLNELIHICEIMISDKTNKNLKMSVLFDIYPQGIHEEIQERDKLYLTSQFQWGRLYLGYNTLGKDWLETYNHNDLEVIKRNQVRPQRRFAAESWLYFSTDCENFYDTIQFEKLYDSLDDDLKQKVPINNLNDLTLGRFEIGKIVINNYFLQYHNNKADWLSINHPIKNKWNREVFSTFKEIIDVKISNNKS